MLGSCLNGQTELKNGDAVVLSVRGVRELV